VAVIARNSVEFANLGLSRAFNQLAASPAFGALLTSNAFSQRMRQEQ
jgi:hypothetical protein